MTVAADLVAALAAGLTADIPVTPPGAAATELPAVAVVPADDSMGEGQRYLVHGYDVKVMVHRDDTVTQLDRLETLADEVATVLVAGGWPIGTRIPYDGGDAEDVHYLARVFRVAKPGAAICP